MRQKRGRARRVGRIVRYKPIRAYRWEKYCEVCGGPFTAKRSHALYCSNKCRQQAWRDRARDKHHVIELQHKGEPLFSQPLY